MIDVVADAGFDPTGAHVRVCSCVLSFVDGTDETVQLRVVHVFDVAEPKKQREPRFDNCVADSDLEDEESDQGSSARPLCSRGETSAEDAAEDDVMGKELSASSSGKHKESEVELADVQGCKIGHTSQ